MHGLPSHCSRNASFVACREQLFSVSQPVSMGFTPPFSVVQLIPAMQPPRHDHPEPTLMLNLHLTAVPECLSSCETLPMHRMCNLLMANQAGTELGPRSFDGVPHNLYINRDSVESLHHLLNVQVGHSAADVLRDLLGKVFCVAPES